MALDALGHYLGDVLLDNEVARPLFDDRLDVEIFMSRSDKEPKRFCSHPFERICLYLDGGAASGLRASQMSGSASPQSDLRESSSISAILRLTSRKSSSLRIARVRAVTYAGRSYFTEWPKP